MLLLVETFDIQRNSKGGELDDDLIGGALKVGSQAPEYLFESVLYKLSYYRFGKARTVSGTSSELFALVLISVSAFDRFAYMYY